MSQALLLFLIIFTSLPVTSLTFAASPVISSGANHTCQITPLTQQLFCWGGNYAGQIGNGYPSQAHVFTPTRFNAPQGVSFASISLGEILSCGLPQDGIPFCWGNNYYGHLGNGNSSHTHVVPPTRVNMPDGVSFTSISLGSSHSCGLTQNGIPFCWGDNFAGQIGNGNLFNTVVPAPTRVNMPDGVSFTSISLGSSHSCGLTQNGIPFCWGDSFAGQIGNGNTSHTPVLTPTRVNMPDGVSFTSISLGAFHSCGLTQNGIPFCWGDNRFGQVGNGNASDVGVLTPTRVNMPDGVSFTSISLGAHHSCGLAQNGIPFCWGDNSKGQIGNGNLSNTLVPAPTRVQMPIGVYLSSISLGAYHSCGITDIGIPLCWGANNEGQLGVGISKVEPKTSPTPVSLPCMTPILERRNQLIQLMSSREHVLSQHSFLGLFPTELNLSLIPYLKFNLQPLVYECFKKSEGLPH